MTNGRDKTEARAIENLQFPLRTCPAVHDVVVVVVIVKSLDSIRRNSQPAGFTRTDLDWRLQSDETKVDQLTGSSLNHLLWAKSQRLHALCTKRRQWVRGAAAAASATPRSGASASSHAQQCKLAQTQTRASTQT